MGILSTDLLKKKAFYLPIVALTLIIMGLIIYYSVHTTRTPNGSNHFIQYFRIFLQIIDNWKHKLINLYKLIVVIDILYSQIY